MKELTFEIESNQELWELFDKSLDSIFIHNFVPNEVIEWWKTDLKTHTGAELQDLSVRQMKMDVQTDLNGLKKIIELNNRHLQVYQFSKPISDTLELDRLPEKSRIQILKQNGLQHFFFLNYEFITIGSDDEKFLNQIEEHPIFKKRISDKHLYNSK